MCTSDFEDQHSNLADVVQSSGGLPGLPTDAVIEHSAAPEARLWLYVAAAVGSGALAVASTAGYAARYTYIPAISEFARQHISEPAHYWLGAVALLSLFMYAAARDECDKVVFPLSDDDALPPTPLDEL